MNVEVTRLPESRVALRIELTADEVEQALSRTHKQLAQRVSIPGFRRGKAPRAILERAVGPEWFAREAAEEAVRWGYRKAVDQEHLVPIDEAEISTGDGDSHAHLTPGQPFHFEATVSVRPEVRLPDYHTIHIERPPVEVSDDEVNRLLDTIRERNATLEPVKRPAQVGDNVTLNLVARVGGEEVISNENAEYDLRDEDADEEAPILPGLSRALTGSVPGDIREPMLSLPETYSPEELAGKTMFVRALVKEVKRRVLPELDDEFAQSVSAHQTLEDLRQGLRANLEIERGLEVDAQTVRDAVEALTSRTFIQMPPVLIEDELDRIVGDVRTMVEGQDVGWQQYLAAAHQTEANVRSEMRETAVENVKQSLVLEAVAEREGIEVTNHEVLAAMDELFRQAGTSTGERRRMRNSAGVRANVRNRIRRQRALQRLVEVMTGGVGVSPEVAEAMADQTAAVAEDTQETVAVEAAG